MLPTFFTDLTELLTLRYDYSVSLDNAIVLLALDATPRNFTSPALIEELKHVRDIMMIEMDKCSRQVARLVHAAKEVLRDREQLGNLIVVFDNITQEYITRVGLSVLTDPDDAETASSQPPSESMLANYEVKRKRSLSLVKRITSGIKRLKSFTARSWPSPVVKPPTRGKGE
jgi:hypothetical protein